MQLIAQPGGKALEAALVRVGRLPLPSSRVKSVVSDAYADDTYHEHPYVDEPSDDEIRMASGGDEYTDNYHDAYGDDPYVDAPYDDYQDNAPEED